MQARFIPMLPAPAGRPRRDARRAMASGLLVAAIGIFAFAPPLAARSAPDSFADLAQKLLPAVVNISSTSVAPSRSQTPELPQFPPGSPFEEFFRDFFDRNRPQQQQRRATSLGSGFVIDTSGVVVTNYHVIQDADEVTVTFHDDTKVDAKIIGRDQKTDLAVLKIEPPKGITAVGWGNSDEARVGDWVVAIGNPFGLGGTVTAGIVSARGRDIRSGPYDDYIQTDASINRGNSGGPLFNMAGDVIGINTAIFSPTGGSIGIGFAIPSSTAKNVVNQLIKFGHTRRGWLGVRIQDVTEEIAESLGLDHPHGALVASVTDDSPAEKGAIKAGDVILAFNGHDVAEMRKLPRIVAETEIGKSVTVDLWREGKKVSTNVVVEELNEEEEQVASRGETGELSAREAEEQAIEPLGMTLSGLTEEVRKKFDLGAEAKGVVVVAVDPAGPAAEKGIRPGDVIVEVTQDEVRVPGEIKAKVQEAKDAGRKSVLLLVEGQNGLRFVAIRIDQV
jgi:serine protease Do